MGKAVHVENQQFLFSHDKFYMQTLSFQTHLICRLQMLSSSTSHVVKTKTTRSTVLL